MVSMNLRYVWTWPGLLKAVSIVFLIIALSLAGHAYENSVYNLVYRLVTILELGPEYIDLKDWDGLAREKWFMAFTTIIFILSVLSMVCHVSNPEVPTDQRIKAFDILFHGVGAVFLLIAGSLLIDSSRRIHSHQCKDFPTPDPDAHYKCQYRAEKDFGGIFTLMTSALYILIGVMQVLRFNNTDPGHGVVA